MKNLIRLFFKNMFVGFSIVFGMLLTGVLIAYSATQLSNVEKGETLTAGTLNEIIDWINNNGATKNYVDNAILGDQKVEYYFGVSRTTMPCNSANDIVSAFGINEGNCSTCMTHASWLNGEWRQWHRNSSNYQLKQDSINVICIK